MRAAPRDEFAKGNEWKIYDYVTRHFIATLHDDMTYTERTVLIDIAGHRLVFYII
jgi:DNA topoisomerase IA